MPNAKPLEMPDSLQPAPTQPSPPHPGSTGAGLRWRLNRLRCMSPAEIGQRLARAFAVQLESRNPAKLARTPPADLSRLPPAWLQRPGGLDPTPWRLAAERLVAGQFDLFALHGRDLGSPPPWNSDPKTGIAAPLSFGKRLDYRDPARVGDIKYLWELNRHAHLVTLAQAWALDGEARHAQVIARHLDDWFTRCPPGLGPNWASALEAGLRLISWSATWQLLGGSDSPLFASATGQALRARWLAAVFQHCRFIASFFSRHSSANNHLIGEASGLYIAALTWPCWPESADWQDTAHTLLEEEAARQTAPDGVNREQSTAYQLFVYDLLLLPLLAARAGGQDFSGAYAARLESMLDYLAAIMDAGGQVPMIGDGDDAVVLRLDPADTPPERFRAALAGGAILFGRGDFKSKAGPLGAPAQWLLPDAAARYAALPAGSAAPVRRAFPDGGVYILGSAFGTAREIRLVADAGPLGYGRLAAHGHADALSFTLALGGEEFLIDPGTCAYHADADWRQYFRGTSAHNTARVDGLDQSTPGGNFMWLRQAHAQCSSWHSSPEVDRFEGWHDGYAGLPDPVRHRRRITLDKAARQIQIEDRFEMIGTHDIELFFHCAEQCHVARGQDGYLLSRHGQHLFIRLPHAGQYSHRIWRGSLAPPLGWISRRYDEREPCVTLRWAARLHGPVSLFTRLLC